MSKKSAKANEQEKPKTKYDKKMEARRKEAKKEKRNSIIFRTICILLAIAVIGSAGYFSVKKILEIHSANNDPYLSIGNHTLTRTAYDYYFNSTVNSYINNYSYFLSYMGLDPSLPYDEQQYSEEMTWQEYFEQLAIEQMKQEYALLDDAAEQGFEYDTTQDYNTFISTAKTTAQESQMTMSAYYKSMFGDYATAANVKEYMENSYTASAYYEKLKEDATPDEDTITEYYEDHKDEYDQVSYYSFTFDPADYTEDTNTEEPESTVEQEDTDAENTESATEQEDTDSEDTESATEQEDTDSEDTKTSSPAYTLALEMAERLEAGEDFETLCLEYAQEDDKTNYEAGDTEYSLTENVTCSQTNADFSEWISDESRKAGDITVIQSESGICYVLKFVSRTYDETCRETISDTLATQEASEYVESLIAGYEAVDIKGEIAYLKAKDTTEETDSSSSESLLNTSIIE